VGGGGGHLLLLVDVCTSSAEEKTAVDVDMSVSGSVVLVLDYHTENI